MLHRHVSFTIQLATRNMNFLTSGHFYQILSIMLSSFILCTPRFGRMKIGKCVDADYGVLGCNTGIRHLVSRVCNGRQYCEVSQHDIPALKHYKPCPGNFTKYMAISYHCEKGEGHAIVQNDFLILKLVMCYVLQGALRQLHIPSANVS